MKTKLCVPGIAALLVLAGCSDDDSTPVAAPPAVSGTAAVGAPVVGGTVSATCAGGSVTAIAVTSATGGYTLDLPPGAAPCALRVTGGSLGAGQLHSFTATGSGTVNITPLTDLILALSVDTAAGAALATWFASPSAWATVSGGLDSARTALATALVAAGHTVPASFNPLSVPFSATAGDGYDDLLESIAAAIDADAGFDDYADLLAAFVAGNDLPVASGGGDTDPEAAAGLGLVAIYAGTWNVEGAGHVRGTVTISEDGATIDFDDGKSFTIDGANVYNRIPQFPATPRVQVEIFEAGQPQQTLRIYVDPDDLSRPVSFELDATVVTVVEGSSGGGVEPIAKAGALALSGSSTLAEAAAAVVGTYDVAIYRAENAADIGPGTFEVSTNGTNLTFTLKRADGTVISSISPALSDTGCGDGFCVQQNDAATVPAGGRRIGLYNYYESNQVAYLGAQFLPDGYISGYASAWGTTNQILFRNNILHYGAGVPAVFNTLAGTFQGAAEALTCAPNTVTIGVTAGGSVSVQGKSSVGCATKDLTVDWDGQDDYLVPTDAGAQLVLNSQDIGGSAPGGGLFVDLPDGTTATLIDRLHVNFAGSDGGITVNDPPRVEM